jgi:DNA-binding transcriptional LysR family regulator
VSATFRVAPDEWECRVFIAVAETYGTAEAARRLQEVRAGYNRQSVEKVLRKLDAWCGEPLLERHADRKLYPTARGREFLDSARKIVARYRVMRREQAGTELPTLACLPHHTLVVAVAEDLLFDRHPSRTEKIVVEYLPEGHRGEDEFHRYAVTLLRENEYQLIIGPRVERSGLESTRLYETRLEAMVSVRYDDAISLGKLVNQHRIFVPPMEMRSRRLLEDAILNAGIEDLGPQRIAAETYDTAIGVMRIRNEDHRRATRDSRLVVAPSDVALAFKRGMEFGGRGAERFKWVPIYYRSPDGQPHLLRQEVCVTTRTGARAQLRPILDALAEAVHQLNNDPSHDGLTGAPFQPTPQVPNPRPAS